jgi:hypothetical protein
MTDFVLLALTPTVIVGLALFMYLHPLNDVFMRTESRPVRFIEGIRLGLRLIEKQPTFEPPPTHINER